MKKSFWILLLCLSSAFVFGDARIMNREKPAWISVESSCKSHLVRVNEPFEFIINSNRKQKLKVIISQIEAYLLITDNKFNAVESRFTKL